MMESRQSGVCDPLVSSTWFPGVGAQGGRDGLGSECLDRSRGGRSPAECWGGTGKTLGTPCAASGGACCGGGGGVCAGVSLMVHPEQHTVNTQQGKTSGPSSHPERERERERESKGAKDTRADVRVRPWYVLSHLSPSRPWSCCRCPRPLWALRCDLGRNAKEGRTFITRWGLPKRDGFYRGEGRSQG